VDDVDLHGAIDVLPTGEGKRSAEHGFATYQIRVTEFRPPAVFTLDFAGPGDFIPTLDLHELPRLGPWKLIKAQDQAVVLPAEGDIGFDGGYKLPAAVH
jgi:hypothetical protein